MKQREFDREVRERLNEERKKRVKARVRHKKNRLEMLLPLQIFIAQSKSLRQVNTAVAEARHVCVLLFLFVTGMRIANCLDLQSKHWNALVNQELLRLPLIKKQCAEYWPVTKSARELAEQAKPFIDLVIRGKAEGQPVITAQGSDQPLSREVLNKRINKVLKKVSILKNKKKSSHSFRIGKTTNWIEVAGIVNAQRLSGHADIQTTALYNRQQLTIKQTRHAVALSENVSPKKPGAAPSQLTDARDSMWFSVTLNNLRDPKSWGPPLENP